MLLVLQLALCLLLNLVIELWDKPLATGLKDFAQTPKV